MTNLHYANQKLIDAIRIFTTHEGDARKRLAAAIPKLKVVRPSMLPEPLSVSYEKVMGQVEKGRSTNFKEMRDYTLPHIYNSTASKLIAEIVRIQNELEILVNEEMGW